ncbi:Hypothetical transmembrane protein coupled to NADH-ubiquinone oxidoreductase chain 5 homolog [Methylomonas albis]|uniref:Probable inorganic carbon transporter subunit DabA n=1 Tax=Methylomonas albis TaxID=1854563 RepID=A0ABR9CZJ3_9GAMM|nr:DUF2309 domain-containing protein [Methylomonas albis]MBD9355404.1 DUF2309 domain-containing protein [Methylomonas albis]CAD6878375.1 Hypothetical transmembrane protein coupled to NADH-ubiquinone oxidoreductase chain 5 homolog [Methylomonas albis]
MSASAHHNVHNNDAFDLDVAIGHIAHWLPSQGPIKDFIHHNTLHAVQDYPFHEGVAVAAQVYGAKSYLPLKDYQQRFAEGRINQKALDWAIAQAACSVYQEESLRASLFEPDDHSHYPPQSLANHGIRSAWLNHLEIDLNGLVHPVMFRLLSNFLDQGISRWAMPKPDERFWDCVLRLVQNSLLPLYPFHQPVVRQMLDAGPDKMIMNCLAKIVGDESLYGQYLLEVLLAHPGWSGMVRIIETQPNVLLAPRAISLKELLAVELACELAFVDKKYGHSFFQIAKLPNLHAIPLLERDATKPQVPLKMRVWHEAMEWSLHSELLLALRSQAAVDQAAEHAPKVQALFCIDDRECSIRRYLEDADAGIETFGAPGFFGIDFLYQGLDDVYPVAQCPVVIKPKHLILESTDKPQPDKAEKGESLANMHFGAHSMVRGWLYTQTLGLAYALRLGWSVLRPGGQLPGIQSLSEVDAHGHLHLLRESEELNEDGYLLGFSLAEMADRVGGLLRNIGLTQHFAPLVVVVAHGSSSVNNPHFAAYDCGACSGKPGAPNARAFAWMANHPQVREILRERGVVIPDSTHFVPALHNTSRDEISYFDQQELDKDTRHALHSFQHSMQHALQRNARERCRWFELGPKSHSNENAHRHVVARASSIFEPRPELNHSNNLYCVVGRRNLTRHLFMDRRAFLQSYDPNSDSDGSILVKVLSAVIPVCGGINLEYLFSRIDNSVYGAGTKLPHNVIGLLGVANGVEGDLRTGLPSQMIEVHEPARLLMVVEQTTAIADQAIAMLGDWREWLDNEWIRLVACDPLTRELSMYSSTGWKVAEPASDKSLPVGSRSEKIIVGQTRTIPVHQLERRQG